MRYLLFFIFISFHLCKGQDSHVLRIVSYRGDVSIDNISIHSGQLVLSSAQKLVVSKNSYVYVLTPKGYSMKLEAGSYNVERIEELIFNKKYRKRSTGLTPTGAVLRDNRPYALVYIGIDEYVSSLQLLGDSTFFRWKKSPYGGTPVKLPYRFTVVSLFDDALYKTETDEGGTKIGLRTVAPGEPVVVIKINENAAPLLSVKFIGTEDSNVILDDLSRVTLDSVSKSILDLVIYDANNLILDLMFKFDKIATHDTTTLPNDLKNYVSLLKTKYEM